MSYEQDLDANYTSEIMNKFSKYDDDKFNMQELGPILLDATGTLADYWSSSDLCKTIEIFLPVFPSHLRTLIFHLET